MPGRRAAAKTARTRKQPACHDAERTRTLRLLAASLLPSLPPSLRLLAARAAVLGLACGRDWAAAAAWMRHSEPFPGHWVCRLSPLNASLTHWQPSPLDAPPIPTRPAGGLDRAAHLRRSSDAPYTSPPSARLIHPYCRPTPPLYLTYSPHLPKPPHPFSHEVTTTLRIRSIHLLPAESNPRRQRKISSSENRNLSDPVILLRKGPNLLLGTACSDPSQSRTQIRICSGFREAGSEPPPPRRRRDHRPAVTVTTIIRWPRLSPSYCPPASESDSPPPTCYHCHAPIVPPAVSPPRAPRAPPRGTRTRGRSPSGRRGRGPAARRRGPGRRRRRCRCHCGAAGRMGRGGTGDYQRKGQSERAGAQVGGALAVV
jgi:hypothetical protein